MKLFGVDSERSYRYPDIDLFQHTWDADKWRASVWIEPEGWTCDLEIWPARLSVCAHYGSARGARDALVRAVKRLGVKVGGKR